jgi:Uma2 family endonuclease
MSTTQSQPRPSARSNRPQPAWDVAYMFPAQGTWSEDDYLTDIKSRGYELCDGRVEMLPVPTELHQRIAAFLFKALDRFVEAQALGLVLFAGLRVKTGADKIREPDIVFMRTEHAKRRETKFWHGADLAVEIVSEDDPERDWKVKRREYAAAGIAEYWIVDPQKNLVTVLKLKGRSYVVHGEFKKGDRATSALLDGFSVDVTATLVHEK